MPAYGEDERESRILAESIRKFGGDDSSCPIWVMLPNGQISEAARRALLALDAQVFPFEIDPAVLEFPFAGKVLAAAEAEVLAGDQTASLVWMDSDTILVGDATDLLLKEGISLAYRPVMVTLISSLYDQPVDAFWEQVYRYCSVPPERAFATTTVIDEKKIRAYFNAGLLAVRPDKGLLRAWRDNFIRLYLQADFQKFYQEHDLYRIFAHQAILAGTALSQLERGEFYELSSKYNFPIHLIDKLPTERRPKRLNDLVTCRYDVFERLASPEWRNSIRVEEPLLGWLDDQLSQPID